MPQVFKAHCMIMFMQSISKSIPAPQRSTEAEDLGKSELECWPGHSAGALHTALITEQHPHQHSDFRGQVCKAAVRLLIGLRAEWYVFISLGKVQCLISAQTSGIQLWYSQEITIFCNENTCCSHRLYIRITYLIIFTVCACSIVCKEMNSIFFRV